MKSWGKVAAVGGLLGVFVFACQRFFQLRTLLPGLSWRDLRDIGHDLGGLGLFLFSFLSSF
ncbi:MAG: hypothetical protein WBW53_18895 [Terriglobales bacterium]